MIAAYKEGLPVQRQVVLTKAFESAEETIKKIQRLARDERLSRRFKRWAYGRGRRQVIDIKTAIQKTGSENGLESPE